MTPELRKLLIKYYEDCKRWEQKISFEDFIIKSCDIETES